MNIGIIASTNGSVFKELYLAIKKLHLKNYSFFVILDRETTLIEFCEKEKIEFTLIKEKNNESFSKKASDYYKSKQVDCILLFFTRMVSEDIFEKFYTLNLHPSLLPAYKGLHPIKRALEDNFKFLGATLHEVNEELDGGKILIQTSKTINEKDTLKTLNKYSFLQKTLLVYILFDYIEHKQFSVEKGFLKNTIGANTSPFFITDKFKKLFLQLQEKEKHCII